jgi:hypothetical protein
MNLNSLLEVLNANTADKFVVGGVKGKVMSATAAANQVSVSVVAQSGKSFDTVANVLSVLKKLNPSEAGAFEVLFNGSPLVSATAEEGYVGCKVS